MKKVFEAIGSLVSFTGVVTFKNAQNVRDAVAAAPLDKFMLETDCPVSRARAVSRQALRTGLCQRNIRICRAIKKLCARRIERGNLQNGETVLPEIVTAPFI
jgi:TatD DNase family protein